MERAAIQLVFSLALGLYVVIFARATYQQPEKMRQHWYPWVPERPWAFKFLRYFSVFWMFGGFIVLANGLVLTPFFDRYRGGLLLAIVLIVACVLTALLAAATPRRSWPGR